MSQRASARITGIIAITLAATALSGVQASARPHRTVAPAASATLDTAVFAGGCFWGVQAVYARVKGVVSATSGYAGGKLARPSYEDVSSGTTGHAESVQVI